jgi:hypothetical protein
MMKNTGIMFNLDGDDKAINNWLKPTKFKVKYIKNKLCLMRKKEKVVIVTFKEQKTISKIDILNEIIGFNNKKL